MASSSKHDRPSRPTSSASRSGSSGGQDQGRSRGGSRGSGKSAEQASGKGAGQVRIISGRWRGRKLVVPEVPGLRPSGDRVRETLFNWLQGDLAGAHCLDLFAGTGVLGLESLSRYARSATFVELDGVAMGHIEKACKQLGVESRVEAFASVTRGQGEPHSATSPAIEPLVSSLAEPEVDRPPQGYFFRGAAHEAVEQFKQRNPRPMYDLVFIDPPFQLQCQWEVLASLAPELLSPGALVYVEAPTSQPVPETLPAGFEWVREKIFSEVTARLVQWGSR